MEILKCLLCLAAAMAASYGSNITPLVFENKVNVLPAAFGDFNSDAMTDVFVLSKDQKSIGIMLAAEEEPLLRLDPKLNCSFNNLIISVVPGDFDGDVFMDIMVATFVKNNKESYTGIHILWGGKSELNCSAAAQPIVKMKGQPVAIDYNQDMIIDLFGMDMQNKRKFWIFNQNRTSPSVIKMEKPSELNTFEISIPHSNAFLNWNDDFLPDLIVTADKYFEIWYGGKKSPSDHQDKSGFYYSHKINIPANYKHKGQAVFLDLELTGKLDLILPVCVDKYCKDSRILVYSKNDWNVLSINLIDSKKVQWGFQERNGQQYQDTITVRGGDFNMDGYPDLLATLSSGTQIRTFLLQNVPCVNCGNFSRTFEVKWNALDPFKNDTIMGVFYDFYQDGILDVILIEKQAKTLQVAAFKNSLDYDANFVKVMVLTGLSNSDYPISPGTLGKKKRTYGTNLPGPSISYRTTTQEGEPRNAAAAQLPQSAYFSLNLPFTTFGLGRTPNFIDSVIVGVGSQSREYPQIIPNSQMVIIPNPLNDPSRWKAQLFVTPSKLILLTAVALICSCIFIMLIIFGLYWKERREDRIEKLQEAHRFHFDAM